MGMHIEFDDFGSYEETADLVPAAVQGEQRKEPEKKSRKMSEKTCKMNLE